MRVMSPALPHDQLHIIAREHRGALCFADSIDFVEDISVNFLILIALGWSVRRRSHMGMVLAGILLI
jgi:hypothetical protein